MSNIFSQLLFGVALATAFITSIASGHPPNVNLKGAETGSWVQRKHRFEQIRGVSPKTNSTNNELIQLLGLEAKHVQRGAPLSEEYTEYYSRLISEVATIRSLAAIEVLVIPEVLNSGKIATRAVAAMGDAAFPIVKANIAEARDNQHKVSLLLVLCYMMEKASPSLPTQDIRQLAVAGLDDPYVMIRATSIRLLGYFRDEDAQTIVRTTAADLTVAAAVRESARDSLNRATVKP